MKQTITIACKDHERTVKATIVGPWAIHPTVVKSGFHPRDITITHIPSNLALVTHVPTTAKATDLARHLVTVAPEWEHLTPADVNTSAFQSAVAKIRPLVQEYR